MATVRPSDLKGNLSSQKADVLLQAILMACVGRIKFFSSPYERKKMKGKQMKENKSGCIEES